MKVESVPIGSIHLDPANVRRHPERNLATIKASLARFGQQSPLVVDAKSIVRKGNGTLAAALSLGWDKIKIVRTGLAGSEATAYSVADNRSSDLAENDDEALAETLRALQEEDFDIESIGFTDAEVDAMFADLAKSTADGEWGEALDGLPDGEKAPFQQMTFTLADEQAASVKAAMDKAKDAGPFVDTGNENSNGNALARMAESYLALR